MAVQTRCWRDVEDALSAVLNRLLLYGPSGTGKTFADLTKGKPMMSLRLVCTEDLTSGKMFGTWMPSEPDRWGFHEGSAIQAWRGVDNEWLEDSATMFACARSRDVFPDRFRLDLGCVEKCAEKAIFDMASFGKGQLDFEPTWEESL